MARLCDRMTCCPCSFLCERSFPRRIAPRRPPGVISRSSAASLTVKRSGKGYVLEKTIALQLRTYKRTGHLMIIEALTHSYLLYTKRARDDAQTPPVFREVVRNYGCFLAKERSLHREILPTRSRFDMNADALFCQRLHGCCQTLFGWKLAHAQRDDRPRGFLFRRLCFN